MKSRNVIRLRSGLSFSGIIESDSPILNQAVDFGICIRPNDKMAIKILIPQNEIESVFHCGNKLEGNDILNFLCDNQE